MAKRRRRRNRVDGRVILVIALAVLLAAAILFGALKFRLDHHVFSEGVLASESGRQTDSDDGYRDCSLEYLTYLKA